MRADWTATGFWMAVGMASKANRWGRGIGAPPSVVGPGTGPNGPVTSPVELQSVIAVGSMLPPAPGA